MIPTRGQGVACKGFDLFDHFVKGLVQVFQFAAVFTLTPSLVIRLVALNSLHLSDLAGRLAASPVFRCDSATPPNGSVDLGPAIAISQRHVYYTPTFAPLRLASACMQKMSKSALSSRVVTGRQTGDDEKSQRAEQQPQDKPLHLRAALLVCHVAADHGAEHKVTRDAECEHHSPPFLVSRSAPKRSEEDIKKVRRLRSSSARAPRAVFHRPPPVPEAALTIARMPALRASGSAGHAVLTAARSGSF